MTKEFSSTSDADETLVTGGESRPHSSELQPGDRVGRYAIEGAVGSGAMGVVYRAHDPELDRSIALKVVDRLPGGAAADQDAFFAEARTLARLSSPNVVAVYDVGRHRGGVFIAMELVEGATLQQWLTTPRDRATILRAFVGAGQGLADAHAAEIVHGDFKPGNVMIDGRERSLVMDFGLARPLEDVIRASESVSLPRGTPAYMAPELFLVGAGGPQADQFAFCVALWEALCGKRPFAGSNPLSLAASVAAGEVQSMPAAARVPRWLERALMRGLASDPQQRWPSMGALLHEITRPRRGLRRAGLALGLVGATALAFSFGARSDARAECERAIDGRPAVWDTDRSTLVRDAILATGAPYADHAAQRFDTAATDYNARWRAAAIELCASGEDVRPAALKAAGQACLEDRRRVFDALATALRQVDDASAALVTDAVEKLPPVEDCTNDVKLAVSQGGVPDDSSGRAEVDAVNTLLSEAWALSNLGKFEDAARLSDEAVVRAEALQVKRPLFNAHIAAGESASRLGQHAKAEPHLRRAYEMAVETGHHAGQLSASLNLAFLVGVGRGDLKLGREWLFQANALLARPEIDDGRRAHFHSVASEIDQADRRIADAIGHQLRLQDIVRRTQGEDSLRYATDSLRMSNLLRKSGKVEEALQLQIAASKVLRAAYGESHPHVAQAANAQALTSLDLGRLEEAVQLFETALSIWQRTLPKDHPTVAFALVNLCRSHAETGNLETALTRCKEAVALREGTLGEDHPLLAYTRSDLAEILRRVGELEAAHDEARLALSALERSLGPDHPNLADALTVSGRILLDLGKPREAIAALRRAVAARDLATYEYIAGEGALSRAALATALRAVSPDSPEAQELARGALLNLKMLPAAGRGRLKEEIDALSVWVEP